MKIICSICRNILICLFLISYEAQNNLVEIVCFNFPTILSHLKDVGEDTPSLEMRLQVMVTIFYEMKFNRIKFSPCPYVDTQPLQVLQYM